ncbi:DUF4350 domain-containing protein [Pseudomonas sp. DC3000-4b1]|uniref:DUF4350 domain-containing protein n=1 Tax=unclassified Pseudomonas TaxID=196821 RepID=UPI003CE77D37
MSRGLPNHWVASLLAVAGAALLSAAWALRADDPFSAGARFLEVQGLKVIRTQDLQPLSLYSPRALSLMLLGSRDQMSASQAQSLLAWVYAGGRLLVSAQGLPSLSQNGNDPLLGPLNIRLLDAYASAGAAPLPAHSTLTALYLETATRPMLLGFAPGRHLEDADDLAQSWANSPQGTHMLQLNLGAGTLTVVSDTGLWRNPAIEQFDNAWLLWYLNQGRNVVLQYRPSVGGLAEVLDRFPLTLGWLFCTLGLLGWWAWPRQFGRARRTASMPAPPPYRTAGGEALLQGLREDLLRRAGYRHPPFAHWPVAAQWQWLAKRSGMSTADIAQALQPHRGRALKPTAFLRQVQQLKAIRNAV